MAEAEVAAFGLQLPLALFVAALAVGGGRVAQVGGVETGAGEEGLVARRRGLRLLGECLVDGVEHEDGVDDPDAGGEVRSAVVDVGVAAGAGAFAQRVVDAQLRAAVVFARAASASSCASSSSGAQPSTLAACRRPSRSRFARACASWAWASSEGAVVDPDGVDGFVFDDGAVHEGAGVAQGGVVQFAGRDPLGDGLGELGGDVVHVGQPVGERDGELAFGGAFGDAGADRLRGG